MRSDRIPVICIFEFRRNEIKAWRMPQEIKRNYALATYLFLRFYPTYAAPYCHMVTSNKTL